MALGLRLRGLGFGLPLLSNFYIRPDESLLVVPAVELFARHGNPGHLYYPALMIETLAILFRFVHAVAFLVGGAASSLSRRFRDEPFSLLFRRPPLSAVSGAALTLLVYRLAIRWASPSVAAVVALWYAVSPLAVREAHFAVTDTPMSLLVACSLLAIARVFANDVDGRPATAAWCGCVAGMAVATKYTAGIVLPAIALALLWGPGATGLTARFGA